MELVSTDENLSENSPKLYSLSFKGNGNEYFGIVIVNFLLTIITLGLYYPWAKARQLQYLYGTTEFNNSRFEFHGTGKEMFKGFIKAIILVGILLGSYIGLILLNHPIFAILIYLTGIALLIPLAIHGSYRYRMSRTSWRGIRFGYRGDRNELMSKFFRDLLLTLITFGIYGAWLSIHLRNYVLSNIRFGNATFKYQGNGGEYLGINVKGYFLTILTLGIYFFWWKRELFEYYINNLVLIDDNKKIKLRTTATGGDFFQLYFINLLIIVFTLGIGYAWVVARSLQFLLSKIEITGNVDLEVIIQTEESFNDATGEDLSDMLDLGFVI